MPFQTSTNQYQVSKYIVDPTAADSCYNTIQAALDAANTAGGNATIYVRNGTYTENLTLYSTLTIKGEIGVLGTAIGTVIVGVHTPPAAGNIVIEGVTLESATDVFNSAVAGTAAIYLERIIFEVTNGFIFNLVNWTGLLNINNAGENSTNNGILNNTGGATLFTNNCQIGAGVGQTMVANGDLRFDLTFIDCPCVFTGGGIISGNFIITGSTISIGGTKTGTIGMGSLIFGTLTTAGTATLAITDTTFETGAIQAITHGSGNQLSLADVTIDSTNNPCIGGAGAGNLLLGSVTYLNNSAIAGTVTKSFATRLETGELKIDDADNGVLHATTGVVTTLGAMVDGDLVIGSTGVNPAVGQLTAGAGVAIASGAGTITISATGSGLAWVEVTAATQAMAVATAYGANRAGGVTFTLPATAAAGTVLEIVGMAGLWVLAQNAGQTVHIGNQSTTTGVGGSLTATNAGDCIVLRCITANTDFRVQNMMGNITIA